MNETLKKRIEEEARDIAELCPDCDLHCKGPSPCIPKIIYEKLIEIADFALQNQWISVKEALPEKNVFVFVRGENTLGTFFNSDYIGCNGNWYLLSNYGTVPDRKITHWMSIPSMEGGEK